MVCKFVFLRFLSISFSNKSYFDGSVYESTDCQNLINKTFVGPHKLDIEHWRRGWFAWMPGPSSVRSCKVALILALMVWIKFKFKTFLGPQFEFLCII